MGSKQTIPKKTKRPSLVCGYEGIPEEETKRENLLIVLPFLKPKGDLHHALQADLEMIYGSFSVGRLWYIPVIQRADEAGRVLWASGTRLGQRPLTRAEWSTFCKRWLDYHTPSNAEPIMGATLGATLGAEIKRLAMLGLLDILGQLPGTPIGKPGTRPSEIRARKDKRLNSKPRKFKAKAARRSDVDNEEDAA